MNRCSLWQQRARLDTVEPVKQAFPADVPPAAHSPAGAPDGHGTVFSHHDGEEHNDSANRDEQASYPSQSPLPPSPSAATPYTGNWPPYALLLVSCLIVAAAGLGGSAARVALQKCFEKNPFFPKYTYIGPNSLGSFLMGFSVTVLPPEGALPLTHRALCVGFCGSFTTFSSWIVKAMVQNTVADALEHLFIGGTMPLVFFLWGRDCGRGVRWCCEHVVDSPWETWPLHRSLLRAVDAVMFVLVFLASILAPVLVLVYIGEGGIRVISTDDVRMVVLAPAGAVTRFMLSVYLNKKACAAQFPLGTLAANLLGVLLAIIMYNMEVNHLSCEWCIAVQNGICGALSTVSSVANELVSFYGSGRMLSAYVYALVSVGFSVFIAGVGRPQLYRHAVS
ncbi:conserved hypothetical protein [Leishmania major strain Friedlin]|uniref:CrcB-like protein n=1 Tax=Leishmania major TaxID=5664 RepID=Q4Q5Z9_LEIMA|nr:conserved hypothetical protein [Leishmania major strain Friedlin]CAG9579441.1 CrcB-like_protein_-_putative [Leishmania major strain Friedlin]CAJ08470.1 conserved hypothetical protein [Leishmania major strain Friedlin]|eukprot:XP_001685249.1 conserved hypothetical protein [Leishmania major strain Friedlin]